MPTTIGQLSRSEQRRRLQLLGNLALVVVVVTLFQCVVALPIRTWSLQVATQQKWLVCLQALSPEQARNRPAYD